MSKGCDRQLACYDKLTNVEQLLKQAVPGQGSKGSDQNFPGSSSLFSLLAFVLKVLNISDLMFVSTSCSWGQNREDDSRGAEAPPPPEG